jgi:hypothetical protein
VVSRRQASAGVHPARSMTAGRRPRIVRPPPGGTSGGGGGVASAYEAGARVWRRACRGSTRSRRRDRFVFAFAVAAIELSCRLGGGHDRQRRQCVHAVVVVRGGRMGALTRQT